MKTVTSVVRVLLGLVFVVFGANYFLHFLPMPPMTGPAADLATALFKSCYLMEATHAIEIVTGLLLLLNLFAPLALVLLAPVLVNIVMFHLFLTPPNTWIVPLTLAAMEVFLMFQYRAYYRSIFVARATRA